jgi:predicted enzyme related to lactoylglutathione lyase
LLSKNPKPRNLKADHEKKRIFLRPPSSAAAVFFDFGASPLQPFSLRCRDLALFDSSKSSKSRLSFKNLPFRRSSARLERVKITEIAFSCYPVTNMGRARAFYETALGLKPTFAAGEPGGMQWTEYDIANGTLALGAGQPGWKPSSDGCSVGLEVEDFDAAISELRNHGAQFHMEPFDTPVCRMAFVYDPDGNAICIHKRKPGHQ